MIIQFPLCRCGTPIRVPQGTDTHVPKELEQLPLTQEATCAAMPTTACRAGCAGRRAVYCVLEDETLRATLFCRVRAWALAAALAEHPQNQGHRYYVREVQP
jgi:hypothetical protein